MAANRSPSPLWGRGARSEGQAKRKNARRTQRGFSLTEGLVATSIIAVAITAMFGLWSGTFRRVGKAREAAQAAQLARAEIERAKVFGMDNLPLGTYNASTQEAKWTGAFNPSNSTWTSAATSYYDASGNRLGTPTTTGVALKLQSTITDTDVLPKSGGYSFQLESRRKFVTTVRSAKDNSVVFEIGTIIAPGGL